MSLRIERENLWRRLSTRFKARRSGEEDEGYVVILPTVQPTTDFDELAKEPQCLADASVDLSGGGLVVIWTVPAGKRWTLKGFHKGTTVGSVYANMKDSSRAAGQTFSLVPAQTAEKTEHRLDYPLDESDSIQAGGGNVADSAIVFKAFIIEEDAF